MSVVGALYETDTSTEIANSIQKLNKNLSHIALCYEYVNTNLGDGLIFDRVLNYDKTPVKSE